MTDKENAKMIGDAIFTFLRKYNLPQAAAWELREIAVMGYDHAARVAQETVREIYGAEPPQT